VVAAIRLFRLISSSFLLSAKRGNAAGFTYAANAMVRFRGTQDRLTLMLAFAFALAGLIETFAIFGFYSQRGAIGLSPQVPMAWMVGRTLAGHADDCGAGGGAARAALAPTGTGNDGGLRSGRNRGLPDQRDLSGNTHRAAGLCHGENCAAMELLPAALFLVAAIGFGRRARVHSTAFDPLTACRSVDQRRMPLGDDAIDEDVRRALHDGGNF